MTEYNSIVGILSDLVSQDEVCLSVLFLLAVLITLILPWFLLFKGHRINKSRYFLSSFPIMKANDVYSGLTLLQGIAESRQPLFSHLTGTPCVWYNYVIQEQWKDSHKKVRIDKKGKKHITREPVYGWSPLYADEQSIDFYLKDSSGQIMISPKGADIEPVTILSRECGTDDPQYFRNAPEGCIPKSTLRRRFIEEVVPLHHVISVLGTAKGGEDAVNPHISHEGNSSPYFISAKDKRDHIMQLIRKTWFYQISGFLLLLVPMICFLLLFSNTPYRPDSLFYSSGILAAYLFTWSLLWKNLSLKFLKRIKKRTRQAWRELEVLFEERKALVEDLYKVVSYYSEGGDIIGESQASLSEKLKTGELTFSSLLIDCPGLSSGKIFLPMLRKLSATEERINLAMRAYNIYTAFYNNYLHKYPGYIIRIFFNKKKLPQSSEIDMSRFEPHFISLSAGEEIQPMKEAV